MSGGHAVAIARGVVRIVEGQPPRVARRLLLPRLRALAADPDEARAVEVGLLELVEQARDEHLAALDADEGLAALVVPWTEVVREAAALVDGAPSGRCPRCGARLPRRRSRCSRCRLATPR